MYFEQLGTSLLIILTPSMLGLFCMFFIVFGFFEVNGSNKSFRSTNSVPNSLDPDKVWHFVEETDLGPNCL